MYPLTMEAPSKPLLHNGFKLNDNLTVTRRIERVYFTDIYLLSDETYLYVFENLAPKDVIPNRRERFNVMNISISNKEYVGIVFKEHSHSIVSRAMEELTTAKGFDCIAGMEDLKAMLLKDVINPLLHPEKYKKFKLSIPNGILLFGPPGCGKTFIVRKLAEEIDYHFIELKHSDVGSPFIHGTANKVANVFEMAKLKAPSIVFIDELSGMVPKRERLDSTSQYKEEEVNEFLMHLNDASDKNVLVVGATNFPDRIDTAILRSGRMDKRIYVSPPDSNARKQLFQMYLAGRPLEGEIEYDELSKRTENFVSSDIELIVDEAARKVVEQDEPISQKVIEGVIERFKPSISPDEIKYFEQFKNLERW